MSIFEKAAKQVPGTSKAKESRTIIGKEFADHLARWTKLKAAVAKAEAEISERAAAIRQRLQQEYIADYKAKKQHPGTIRARSEAGDTVQLIVTDRYPSLDEAQANMVNKLAGEEIAVQKTVYSFNPEILERHISAIAAAIEALDIPQEDKDNLLTAKTSWSCEKGTINRLATFKGKVEDMYLIVSPVTQLKDA